MGSKQANRIANKARKQRRAKAMLHAARASGGNAAVVLAVLSGNQYVRQVAEGKHIADGAEPFVFTDEEREDLDSAHKVIRLVALRSGDTEEDVLRVLLSGRTSISQLRDRLVTARLVTTE